MFFPSHPVMVQVMSFDIKIHQISIDSKNKQCFDFIEFVKVHYHLKCRKYSNNSGVNENILCFSHFIQLWLRSCPLTPKFIKFQLIASTKSVFISLGLTVHYHLYCRKYADNSGDNENILCFSHFI